MKNLKYLLFSLFLILSFNSNVNAWGYNDFTFDYSYSRLGGKSFRTSGDLYWLGANEQRTEGSRLHFKVLRSKANITGYYPTSKEKYYLQLDICSTGDSVISDVYSSYYNKIDYIHKNENKCSLDWTSANYYTIYLTLELSGFDVLDTDPYVYEIWFTQTYNFHNKDVNNGVGFRFDWVTIIDKTEYDNILLKYGVIKSSEDVGKKLEEDNLTLWQKIAALPGDIWNKMSSSFSSMISYLSNLPSGIWSAISTGFDWIVDSLEDVGDFIISLPSGIWSAIKGGFEGIVDVIDGLYHWIFKVDYEVPVDVTSDGLTGSGIGGGTGFVKGQIGWFPAGPVDNIINLPFTFLNNINTNLSNQCTPASLPLPYVDKNLPLPCINSIYSNIGTGLTTWIQTISVLISGLILYRYFLSLYKWVDNTLTFRENNHLDNWGGL